MLSAQIAVPIWAADGPRRSVLHLANGDFVAGDLLGSDQSKTLRWRSDAFAAPLTFPFDAVNAVQMAVGADLPRPSGEFCLELLDGDVLFGDLQTVSADLVDLQTEYFGRLKVRRDHVRRLIHWDAGSDLIYLGPNGLSGWDQTSPGEWREEGGQPLTDQFGASLFADLGLPDRSVIEIEIAWKNKPDFVLALGIDETDTSLRQAFRCEVWDQDLVVQRELTQRADVAAVQTIAPGAGKTHLLLYLDQQHNHLLVQSPGGTLLADLTIGPKQPTIHSGLRITNKRGDVRLERLRISRWDGVPPRDVPGDKSRVYRSDGSTLDGHVTGFDASRKQFILQQSKQETRIAADQVSSVVLPAVNGAAASNSSVQRTCRVVYQSGTRLSGELKAVQNDALTMRVPGIENDVRLPVAELHSLVVLHRDDVAPRTAEARTGTLELDGLRLKGWLQDGRSTSAASCLVWNAERGLDGVPLRPGVTGRIVYREPPPPPKPTQQRQVQPARPLGFAEVFLQALAGNAPATPTAPSGRRALHLRDGDTIPCEVAKIDEQGVTFRTNLTDATFVPHERIKALELASVAAPPKLAKAKRERLLTLPRMQKDSPPTHLVTSKNGDVLRGRVIDLDDKVLRVEVHLETKQIPRDRIAQIIWFHPDELAETAAKVDPPGSTAMATRVQAMRSDGIRMTFVADELAGKTLSGKSDVLGTCRADIAQVDQLLLGSAIEKAAANLAYHRWKLQNAIEPKFVTESGDPASAGRQTGEESPLVGKPAPDFELNLLNGKKFRLADQKGKIIVLDFWATWCGPCLRSMPVVDRVVREFADQNVQLIAVNLEEPPKQVAAMLERHKLDLTVALDQDGVVGLKYNAASIPQTVVIDRNGTLRRLYIGGDDNLEVDLRKAVQDFLGDAQSTDRAP